MKRRITLTLAFLIGLTTICFAQDNTDENAPARKKLEEIGKPTFRQTIWNPNKNKKFTYTGSKIILLDFGAKWCKPCKKTTPILEELNAEYGDTIQMYSIDIDNEANSQPDYPKVFKFENIPAIVVIKPNMKKTPVAYRIGGKTKEEIRELIDALIAENK
ncbi:MAG: conjugal transfer protein TraF [Paludibacteraceae bacterium]|nr:conjugal transfer protein TraF [Paludibacteraceae bacterium]